MADRRVKVILDAQVDRYRSAMATAARSTEELEKAAKETGSTTAKQTLAMRQLAPAVTTAGVATLSGFALAAKGAADFDKAMSSVQAATHESTGNMDLLREAAVRTGADTAFSAVEAAQGIEELAKAGVSTTDVLNGGLDGALALAAAGGLGVAEASEIAASALTQFKLEGEQVPHVADLLAAGAGKAQGSVQDMGAALNQSGLVASQLGLTIEETTGGLAAFASAGLVGSDAGTSFKSMLQRLTPQSKEAANLMDDLGLSAFDSQGKFIGLSEYAGELRTALAGMTDEQRNSTLATLFGSDAVRAAAVLYENGAEGVQKWEDAVNDAGYAAETAALLQDNLAGDLEKLGGAFDTVLIQSGSGANEALRGLVQGLESFVDLVGQIPAPVLSIGGVITGVAGGAAVLAGGLITVIPKVKETRDALRDLAADGSKVPGRLRAIGKAAGFLTGLATFATIGGQIQAAGYLKDIPEGTGHIADALARVANEAPGAADALESVFLGSNGEGLSPTITDMDAAINELFGDGIEEKAERWVQGIITPLTGIKGSVQIAKDAFAGMDAELANMVSSGNAEDAEQAMEQIRKKLEDSGVEADEAAALFPAYADAVARAGAEAETSAGGIEEIKDPLQESAEAAQEGADALSEYFDMLVKTGQIAISEQQAFIDLEKAISGSTETIKENGKSIDISTEKGQQNVESLLGISNATLGVISAMHAKGRTAGEMAVEVQKGRDAFVAAALAAGYEADEANRLADEQGLIPANVFTEYQSNAEGEIQKITDLHTWIQSTPDKTITISDNSPVTIAALRELGYIVTELPDGRIQVSETGTTETGEKIDATAGKERTSKIDAVAITGAAETALNQAARDRTSHITQRISTTIHTNYTQTGQRAAERKNYGQSRQQHGGRVRRRYSTGGRLPATGLGVDKILGIDEHGNPTAWVDDLEWVINRRSSDKHDRLLRMINADDPRVDQMKNAIGLAGGGRPGALLSGRDLVAPPAFAGRPAVSVQVPEIADQVASAVTAAIRESFPDTLQADFGAGSQRVLADIVDTQVHQATFGSGSIYNKR
ncbi:phage tail tape measure protein [Zhihengliuella sp.]|uniref:phage tail tape measure protein n=1 Tax=Zhihengliuella sp. TaxID=1954483 RepID=UPI0028121325|nr:phage tail tape measure protein [Zhihengliuella sp.]